MAARDEPLLRGTTILCTRLRNLLPAVAPRARARKRRLVLPTHSSGWNAPLRKLRMGTRTSTRTARPS
eukprot:5695118-Prymnesium_polylepis.2